MDGLVHVGRLIAPLAIDGTVTISLAAIAGLLAARLLGRRHPARSFTLLAAAFGAAALLVANRSPMGVEAAPPDQPSAWEVPAPAGPAPQEVPAAAPARTATPGLSGKYGSMFQVLIQRKAPAAAAAGNPAGAAGTPWAAGLGLAWLGGFLVLAGRQALGILASQRLLACSRPCRDPRLLQVAESARILLDGRRVEVRLLDGGRTALVAGLLRPRILLPAEAAQWPPERLASTLLHEHMHAQRLDVPVTEGMRLLAALAWWSPFPWRALGLALDLREQACDAAVVRAGIPRAAYATDLLEAARSLARDARPAAAAAMGARGSRLEARILAILDRSGGRPGWELRLRTAAAAGLVALALGAARLAGPLYRIPELGAGESQPRGSGEWVAGADPGSGGGADRGAFALSVADGYARIRLRFRGRASEVRVPAVALPQVLPLGAQARIMVPFGDLVDGRSRQPFFNPGWSIWGERRAPALAAGSGRVMVSRVDPRYGPVLELAHGGGLRTRYGLGPGGGRLVQAGEFVAAGTPLGIPGVPCTLDLPVLGFSILVETGEGRVALDPAPFLLAAAGNRRAPLAAGVLNAAVRLEDRAELGRLLALGIDPDRPAADGTLPLEWALMNRNLPIARALLAAGADPRVPTWDVHQACIARRGPTVRELALGSGDPVLAALLGAP